MRRRTIRVRLTALYAGLFLATATVLLVTVNLLMEGILRVQISGTRGPDGAEIPQDAAARVAIGLHYSVLRWQWLVTGVVIAVLTVVSVAVGWWLAGRVLRPIHTITATARRLSLSSLHQRISLDGPRDDLKELADTFDDMLDRLERSVESQRRFVANASHELRTPLAIQRAAIEIGLTAPSLERLPQVRRELLNATERSERLIEALLTLAQSEHGLDSREPVALDEVVRKAVREVRAGEIEVTADAEPVTVAGDPTLLARLVTNLLDNAVRYNRPDGQVAVGLSADGTLTVRNTGPAVPPDRVTELFEPFRRLHPARSRSNGGAGLGLSIVAAIARAHDAEVTARPNAGVGGGLELTVRFVRP
ncbi:ATP-binding protein [Spongiactinospora sp. TRM90649]|uniref:sensor histidine kinase n=1 Tax=Spongiactinospora sp. TRM90649 TaxID=3031114 RepID=UPI0023F96663|nr:ATP-binding protein [Spongiactinospora sp. TRM90649]MDF5756200.1 ATP-binding protein [Spongiactinospora sp. TRM90649]